MGVKIGEIFMTADMVPMNMRRYGGNGFICQLANLFVNIANTEPRIDQQAPLASDQKIAVCFFWVAVFADNVSAVVDFFYRKPMIRIFRRNFLIGVGHGFFFFKFTQQLVYYFIVEYDEFIPKEFRYEV